ncbi:lipopolysaccharide biosynthesis protein [Vreelandella profundi]|uniref:lipopolysaccharide biosynthesis protein n=1 Tax=Vreelandella profundi TaxID=2852117 RepID=UPI001EF107B7|nr:oligosaccharide flippase family protein [Halomonas profundi]
MTTSNQKKFFKLKLWKNKAFSGPASVVLNGMLTLAMGSIVARIIGFASIPILTRLYSPEDFGMLAFFISVVSMLAPIVTLRYVLAVPLPRNDGIAINLMLLSVFLMFFMSLIVAFLLFLFGERLFSYFSMQMLEPYWWLIFLGLVGGSGYEILSIWATRKRAYKPIAHTTAIQSLTGNLIKLVLGFLAIKPFGLLIGQVVATSGGIVSLSIRFKEDFIRNQKHIRLSRIKLVALRYRNFPIYRLPSQFLLVFCAQAPLLFTALIYDAQTTGQLGLALMALSLPIGLLSSSMSRAYYAEISHIGKSQPGKIREITLSMLKKLFVISLLPALVLAIFGEFIFSIIFGKEWQLAGQLAELLAIYLVFQFLQVPVSRILFVFEGHILLLILNVQRAVIVTGCFAAAYYNQMTVTSVIFLYSIMLSAQYVLSIFYTLKFIPEQEMSHGSNS